MGRAAVRRWQEAEVLRGAASRRDIVAHGAARREAHIRSTGREAATGRSTVSRVWSEAASDFCARARIGLSASPPSGGLPASVSGSDSPQTTRRAIRRWSPSSAPSPTCAAR